MRKESLEAYSNLLNSGSLQRREKEVLTALISLKGGTDLQIAEWLGWQINQVTGRRNRLEKNGIVESYKKIKQNGRMVNFWRVCNEN